MKWSISAWIAVLCLALGAMPAKAQSTSYVSATKFASLQDRLDQVEADLARYRNADGGVSSCDDGGDDAWPCYTSGLVFGAEVAVLRPFQSEGQMEGFDYKAAPRIWLGWQNSNGFGLRARWFDYDGGGASPTSIYSDVGMETFDLEVTDTFTLGKKWEGLLSAGVRYAEFTETRTVGGGVLETDGALGLVVGAELYRPLTCNLYLFGIGRTAFMYADATNNNGTLNPDTTFNISELQVGVEYRRYLSGTTRLFARAAVEGQYWAGMSDRDTEDVSLIGGTFAVGIAR